MLTLRQRRRFYGRPKAGERGGWFLEWQILDGRKILHRNEVKEWAMKWAAEHYPERPLMTEQRINPTRSD